MKQCTCYKIPCTCSGITVVPVHMRSLSLLVESIAQRWNIAQQTTPQNDIRAAMRRVIQAIEE